MKEKPERDISEAEERRRLYGAEQDAETERQQEKTAALPDDRQDLYGNADDDCEKDGGKSGLEKAVEEEQEELEHRRPPSEKNR